MEKHAKEEEDMGEENETGYQAEGYEMEWTVCRICGQRNRNKIYTVKEMMYGTKQEFPYFVCDNCKCMQIAEVPDNLGEYYCNDYYSLGKRKVKFEGAAIHTEARILDVGCGTGDYLLGLAEMGYGNLYGCDPFIEEDIRYGDRIYIKKCEISQMEGKFDRIRFGDSFEHIGNPLETLQNVKRLLKENGICQINLPIFPNAAFDTFGVNWYQIDAPRHIFLYSKESMEYLCEKSGLKIEEIDFNSSEGQFICSYFYELGIPMKTFQRHWNILINELLDSESVQFFKKTTKEMNEKGYSDHACLTIVHL